MLPCVILQRPDLSVYLGMGFHPIMADIHVALMDEMCFKMQDIYYKNLYRETLLQIGFLLPR